MKNMDQEIQLAQIAESIRHMTLLDPPEDLADGVMKAIRERKVFWWRRVIDWIGSPKYIAVRPIYLAPVAAVFVGFCLTTYLLLFGGHSGSNMKGFSSGHTSVVFTLKMPEAQSVAVIGTFNQWRAEGYELKWVEEKGLWTLRMSLPRGRHEYAFLIDGIQIIPDPNAMLYQKDGFGQRNAVLILGTNHEDKV
jgi:hypothetical protein